MIAVVRALSEAEWWRLARGVEGMPGEGPIEELPTIDARSGLAGALMARDRAAMWLMGGCGLRVAELCGLTMLDFFFGQTPCRQLVVHAGIAKGGRPRIVPMSIHVQVAVLRLRGCLVTIDAYRTAAAVMGGRVGWQPITVRRVQQWVHEIGWAYVGRDLTPHMLRHTFATRLRRRVDLSVVQALLGHARLSSTQVYLGVAEPELSSAVASLDGAGAPPA